ncbi:uncharacterized protein LOC113682099 [Pocillopora damicornis]|uniref:uncharacterized protein LOC113682099 n=1 Tax=Pocillopora damicornis TaxID=46731 RepID=UPI000F54DE33|nr:uncharacterized protein LOC113682099 [Pocillopora damicornis]
MGTAKLEGTSPLTVVPTTGYGKELEEPWGRKGMLPLPGSSIFGPEEELVEPRMKLQRIKGASSSEFHSISSISKSPQNQEELKKWKQKTKIVETEKLKGTSPLTVIPTTGHGKELIGKAQGRKGEQEAQFELISKVDMFSVFSYYVKFEINHLEKLSHHNKPQPT